MVDATNKPAYSPSAVGIPREEGAVPPNRVAILATVVVATLLGCIPYVLFVQRPILFAAIGVVVLLLSLKPLVRFQSRTTTHPGIGEWILATIATTSYASAGSGTALFFFLIAYWLTRLCVWIAGLFDWIITPTYTVAHVVAGGFLLLFIGGHSVEAVGKLGRALYPDRAGVRSRFRAVLRRPKRLAWFTLAAVAALAIILVFWHDSRITLVVLLSFYLFYATAWLTPLLNAPDPSTSLDERILGDLGEALQKLGYDVETGARTGDPAVDPLLESIHLLARNKQGLLAVGVLARPEDSGSDALSELSWTEGSDFHSAVGVLENYLHSSGELDLRIEPSLILVGVRPSEPLSDFAREEGIHLSCHESEKALVASLESNPASQFGLGAAGHPDGTAHFTSEREEAP